MNYTNETARTAQINCFDLGLVSNYAVIVDEPSQVVLDNTTATLDQQELISRRRRTVGKVNTDLNIQYPAKNTTGVSYAYQIEETVVESDETMGRQDHPVKIYLTVVHDRSAVITNDVLDKALKRLLSSLPFTVEDGKVVFLLLNTARGALRPMSD
jgi:hypothetical protein